jgi:hypothetical protein
LPKWSRIGESFGRFPKITKWPIVASVTLSDQADAPKTGWLNRSVYLSYPKTRGLEKQLDFGELRYQNRNQGVTVDSKERLLAF